MSDFESYDCANCGEGFEAHQSAAAAETGYCSPKCHSAGEGL